MIKYKILFFDTAEHCNADKNDTRSRYNLSYKLYEEQSHG